MTRDEAKKRLKVWLICANCPEEKKCYDSYLHSTCEYTDYCDEVPIEEAVKVAIEALEQEPKTGHCKDCKYFEYNSVAKVDGIPLIVAHEICSRWGDGCKTSEDGYCFLFEPKEEANDDKV